MRPLHVDPELAPLLAGLPPSPMNSYADPEALRTSFRAVIGASASAFDDRVDIDSRSLPEGIDVDLVRPRARARTLRGAVLSIHGGGFTYGEVDGTLPQTRDLAVTADAVVVAPRYRLAPEHPFPAGLEDCYATLVWLHEHAEELGVDPDRIAITGASAGACLSAGVALLARDRGGPAVALQCLCIPVLDDRLETTSMREFTDPRVINGPGMREMWDSYLGPHRDPARTPAIAAPARCDDLSGMPPTYVLTCGLDPLRDEGLAFAQRLAQADVPVTLHHVPGAWHFFEAYAPDSSIARATTRHWMQAIADALSP